MFTVYDNHGFQNTFYSGQELIGGSCRESIPFEGGVIYPIDAVLNIPGPVEKEVGGYKEGTLFIEALERAGLLGQVQQMKDVTFLVPNNTAYQLVEESLNALSAEDLADVLKYHIIPDKIGYYGDVEDGTKMKTLQGQEVTFGVRNNRYSAFVDGAMLYYVDTPWPTACSTPSTKSSTPRLPSPHPPRLNQACRPFRPMPFPQPLVETTAPLLPPVRPLKHTLVLPVCQSPKLAPSASSP